MNNSHLKTEPSRSLLKFKFNVLEVIWVCRTEQRKWNRPSCAPQNDWHWQENVCRPWWQDWQLCTDITWSHQRSYEKKMRFVLMCDIWPITGFTGPSRFHSTYDWTRGWIARRSFQYSTTTPTQPPPTTTITKTTSKFRNMKENKEENRLMWFGFASEICPKQYSSKRNK